MIINLPSDEWEGIVEKLDCTSLAALICESSLWVFDAAEKSTMYFRKTIANRADFRIALTL